MNGFGTFYWSNNDRYEGNFINGLKNGYGVCFYADYHKYEGNSAHFYAFKICEKLIYFKFTKVIICLIKELVMEHIIIQIMINTWVNF